MLTLELRWFVARPVDESELRAFADDGRVEARTDRYLLGTGEAAGIKRRGGAGRLEHKRRIAQTPVQVPREPAPLGGLAERWEKTWPKRLDARADASWAAVDKRRALRRLGACRAELTLLHAAQLASPCSTLAIETADVDDLDALIHAAASLLRAYPQLSASLDAEEAYGYPAWLARQRARWESNPQPTG